MARNASKDISALTHIDASGEARMVDVSAKPATERIAVAEGCVVMSKATLELIVSGNAKKGDVLGTARVAGIMAAKRTSDLIPLCHPLALSKVTVDIAPDEKLPGCIVRATVKVTGPTGVEMEARTMRSEEHTSELQSHLNLVCRLLLEKKKIHQLYLWTRAYISESFTSHG